MHQGAQPGVGKFTEHEAAHAFEFSGLAQMQQHAIELIGTHTAIFEDEDRTARVEFPRRAERGLEQRDATAEHAARR